MANRSWDALIFADPRFIGGTSSAIATDVRAFRAIGLRVGIRFVYAVDYFDPEDGENPVFEELFSLDGVDKVEGEGLAKAEVAFFHHPAIFFRSVENPLQINATRSVIVTHQPLYWGDGALALNPMKVQRNIQDQFGVHPDWAPISGLCRRQYRTFAPFLRLTSADWINTFNADEWTPTREKLFSADMVVGRHGRPNRDKWPDTGPELSASLPATANTKIRVMGASGGFFDAFGVDTSAWEILEFNQEPVLDFLDSLDVFSYFHSGLWTEAFGRTIAEAMLMQTRCVLDRALEPTFGKHAIYCTPSEVPDVLARIRDDLPGARAAALAAREHCLREYSTRSVAARYEALLVDPGTATRRGGGSIGPLTTARKFIGFHRRQRRARKQQVTQ